MADVPGDAHVKERFGPADLFGHLGYLLLLAGLAFVLVTLAASESSAPAVLDRYSLPLALAILVLGILFAAGCLLPVFRHAATVSLFRSVFRSAGRVPGLLELTVAFGWVPVVLLLVGGSMLTPLAGEPGFIRGLFLLYLGWVTLSVTLSTGERRKSLLERLLLLGVSSLIGLLAIELTLRAVSPGSVFSPDIELIPYQHMEIQVDLPDMSPVAVHTTNKWGLRGEDPPADWDDWFTIVTIGGSTTHCFYTDDDRTWSHLLQENLRESDSLVWVGNGGLSGHTTRAHILFMREVVPVISPDMVVLLVGTNDAANSTRETRADLDIRDERTTLRYRIFASSRLLQVLYRWVQINWGGVHSLSENLPPYEPQPMQGPEMELPDDIRELCTTLDDYAANIRTIIRLGREEGVRVVFMTQPYLWEDNEYWRGIEESYYWEASDESRLSAATAGRILDAFNRELLSVCAEEGVPCLDLASLVPHSPEAFYDAVHFNETGSAMVARFLSEFLLEEGLVPSR
jgi:lysophospholipase L1-like esterase